MTASQFFQAMLALCQRDFFFLWLVLAFFILFGYAITYTAGLILNTEDPPDGL